MFRWECRTSLWKTVFSGNINKHSVESSLSDEHVWRHSKNHTFLWKCVSTQQKPMEIYENQWTSMNTHGHRRTSLNINEHTMTSDESQWLSMDTQWESMNIDGSWQT